jgi:hypothetical protein
LIRIRFGAKDRDRMGLPEVVEYDPGALMVKHAFKLKDQTGWTLDILDAKLKDEDLGTRLQAQGVFYWFACVSAGYPITWDDFDCDMLATEMESDPNPPAPSGA